jgi:hypothetical protein
MQFPPRAKRQAAGRLHRSSHETLRGQSELFGRPIPEQYKLSGDFRRQIKARTMIHPLPIQIITNRPFD